MRQCEFCNRFWRAVIAYVLPIVVILVVGFGAGCVAAFYWASNP